MCGKNGQGEEEDLAPGMDDVEEEKSCARPSRILLFILNFIIWLGSCALLALGIYLLVDSPFTREILDGNTILVAAIVLIVVGGIGFIISFIGCCGAFLRNKCLVLTYVIVLVLLLTILLVGGILGIMFQTRLQTAAKEAMRKSMSQYDPNDSEKKVNVGWDAMQRSIKCCGIMSHKDWEKNNNAYKSSTKFPESCCVIDDQTQTIRSGCTTGSNTNNFYADKGCHDKLIMLLDDKAPYVAIVGAIVAFCMILGVILGIVVYTRL